MKTIEIKSNESWECNKAIMLSNSWIAQIGNVYGRKASKLCIYQIDVLSSEAIVPFGNVIKKSLSDLKFQF